MVTLVGELDIAGTQLRAWTAALAHRYNAEQVTFDCSRLIIVDAYGVGVLLNITRKFGGGM